MNFIDFTNISYKYQNKWIALDHELKVIAEGDSLEEILQLAKQKGCEDPITTKVPDQKYSYVF